MNCSEVQDQLSEYIDGGLERSRVSAIDGHLSSCVNCRAEADDLKDIITLMAATPQLEPHPSFPGRVMVHVREFSSKPRFWQILINSRRFAIPIQTVALVLVTVLAGYLYQKESQNVWHVATLPTERSIEQRRAADTHLRVLPGQQRQPSVQGGAPMELSKAEEGRSIAQPSPKDPVGSKAEDLAASDQELTVRLRLGGRRPETMHGTMGDRWRDVELAAARVIKTGEPQTVSVILASTEYKQLLKDLSELGEVERKKTSAARTHPGSESAQTASLRIKIFLTPESTLRR